MATVFISQKLTNVGHWVFYLSSMLPPRKLGNKHTNAAIYILLFLLPTETQMVL